MLISADSVDSLNDSVNKKLSEGMFLWGSPFIVPNTYHNQTRFFQQVSDMDPLARGKNAYQLWIEIQGNENKTLDDFFEFTSGVRKKSEVYWSGINFIISQDTPINLISALKNITPISGNLSPFFDIIDNKFHPFNQNSTTTFKLNLKGTFTGPNTSPRSVTLDFSNTNGNTLTLNRTDSVTVSTLSFVTFFSVDKGGNLATNGTPVTIFSSGSPFTVTEILLVAEQRVFE